MDGTLIDTVDLHARAWKDAFDYFGQEIPLEKIRSQIGKGGDHIKPIFLDEDELSTFGKELETYRAEHWKRNYMKHVKPFPAVRDLFERIRRDGKKIVLASSAKGDELGAYKRIAHIDGLIDDETSASDVEHSKPDPDIFLSAMDKIGLASSTEIVVVGDSPYDALAAGRIGLPVIGLRCGGFSDEDLREAGVLQIFDDPADLLHQYDLSILAQ